MAEGDVLVAELLSDGRLVLTSEGRAVVKAEVRRLRRFLGQQKETPPVVAGMRRGARS